VSLRLRVAFSFNFILVLQFEILSVHRQNIQNFRIQGDLRHAGR
jgi:hypothetical protein